MTLPDAVLFDCDGTLVDSETVTVDAMRASLADLGHTLTGADVAGMVGHTWPRSRARLIDRFGLTDGDLEAYRVSMQRLARPLMDDPAIVFEDVLEVLDLLRAADVPLGVVTSSGRDHLSRVLDLEPLRDRFAVRIAREDVEEHKPSPVPYLAALSELRALTGRQLPVERVTVVEDSAAGIAAGLAAGCFTVAVDRGAALHDLTPAHRVVTRLRIDDLTAV